MGSPSRGTRTHTDKVCKHLSLCPMIGRLLDWWPTQEYLPEHPFGLGLSERTDDVTSRLGLASWLATTRMAYSYKPKRHPRSGDARPSSIRTPSDKGLSLRSAVRVLCTVSAIQPIPPIKGQPIVSRTSLPPPLRPRSDYQGPPTGWHPPPPFYHRSLLRRILRNTLLTIFPNR